MPRSTPAIFLLLFGLSPAASFAATVTPAQRCEADVELASAKFAQCTLKAEAKYSQSLDADKRASALARCSEKLQLSFAKAVARYGLNCTDVPVAEFDAYLRRCSDDTVAAAAGGAFPNCSGDLATCNADLSTCNGDLSTAQSSLSTCTSSLSVAQNGLTACTSDRVACLTSLGACGSDLDSCGTALSAAQGDLAACDGNLATCSASLASAQSGTALASDVLAGRTFSSSAGQSVVGVMPNNHAVSITPSTAPQPIPAGYHDGSGVVLGDPNLLPQNIASGVEIFGVTGTSAITSYFFSGRINTSNVSDGFGAPFGVSAMGTPASLYETLGPARACRVANLSAQYDHTSLSPRGVSIIANGIYVLQCSVAANAQDCSTVESPEIPALARLVMRGSGTDGVSFSWECIAD